MKQHSFTHILLLPIKFKLMLASFKHIIYYKENNVKYEFLFFTRISAMMKNTRYLYNKHCVVNQYSMSYITIVDTSRAAKPSGYGGGVPIIKYGQLVIINLDLVLYARSGGGSSENLFNITAQALYPSSSVTGGIAIFASSDETVLSGNISVTASGVVYVNESKPHTKAGRVCINFAYFVS